ncbi:MAG: hypothetical protein ABSG69_09240 [Candidatus Acidiferrum sp.]|jgi:hypothetical protein
MSTPKQSSRSASPSASVTAAAAKQGAQRGAKRGAAPVAEKGATAAAKQIDGFIAKFDPTIAKEIRACRALLRKRFPTANEIVYDNYNFFVIGYCSTLRSSDCIVSVAANSKGVGLSFYWGSTLPDPHKILLGSGTQNRFVRLPTPETLSDPKVSALIDAAVAQAKVPLAIGKRGVSIVKSISTKQRPRRA